jgi:hypothetical protein
MFGFTKHAENMWTLRAPNNHQLLSVEPSHHFCVCINLNVLVSVIGRVPRNYVSGGRIVPCLNYAQRGGALIIVNIVRSGFQNFSSWERCESESDSETKTKGNINIRPWSGCCKSGRMFTTTPGVSSIIVDSISGCLRDVKK